ncbi:MULTISPECIES: zinc-binding dehydrogenase [unclassified Crossiella]|uniref:zinc-binding dehydrogenase n=1 Tax=unclassified Crossiella TaxID=2620835 RepID=UPI001FFF8A27|nr:MULTISPECIES: zinc-binding dehydrogenase [unclassified Crossiella]MCK2238556.1 zinc-binding dehydrogenase [Crossiella sp. S99.2]MCK2251874.1 zinc-binding dehydrogenase [Crossiella sp. S99.1]
MRAVWLREFGGPEVLQLGDAPDPVPGQGQVLIEVAYANITFVETQFRAGGDSPFRVELPVIPGNGVGGTVLATGPSVDPDLVGERVISSLTGSGGYAELAVAAAATLHRVPAELPLDSAVALLADGRTAAMLLRATEVKPGERVLVEAAAGGVGSLLVQLAVAAGATVVAAAGGAHKTELAASLGAAEVADYTEPGWAQRIAPVDVVFDGVGGEIGRAAFDLLGQGGRMISYGLASGEWAGIAEETAAERGVTLVSLRPSPELVRESTRHVLAEAAAGRLHPVIGQRFPLAEAAAAHTAIANRGTIGKTLLEVK